MIIDRGHIWRNGIELDIHADRIVLVKNHSTFAGNIAKRCQVGLAIGDVPVGLGGAILVGAMREPYPDAALTEGRVVLITATSEDDAQSLIEEFKSFLDDVSPDDFAV